MMPFLCFLDSCHPGHAIPSGVHQHDLRVFLVSCSTSVGVDAGLECVIQENPRLDCFKVGTERVFLIVKSQKMYH